MSHLAFCGLTAAFAVLGLLVILLDLNRRRWREIAGNRQRFIDDCNKAAEVPLFWVFGPSFLAMRAREVSSLEIRLKSKNRSLADTIRIKNHYRERGDALEQQAKRWAKTANQQRETIRELTDLLQNHTGRIEDRAIADGVDVLRSLGFRLMSQDQPDAARFVYASAAEIEARLLRHTILCQPRSGEVDEPAQLV